MDTKIILASGSSSRLKLLKQIGITPDEIISTDIDESRLKSETGKAMSLRLAKAKAQFVADSAFPKMNSKKAVLIAADTVPVCNGQIMRKAESLEDIEESIKLLSGRRHSVYTGVCMMHLSEDGIVRTSSKVVKTILKFRQIPQKEIEYFISLREGLGKAGGYTLYGYAESFTSHISGSVSNVIGLPLAQVVSFLRSNGVCF